MSQVVRAIEAHDTGDRKLIKESFSTLFQDVFNIKSHIQDLIGTEGIAKQYRISVTIGSQVHVSDLDLLQEGGDALEEAIHRTKRQVIESIYGEFRQDLMLAERALYDRDFQKARDCLRILEQKMFGIE
jgi:alcohol dehydrogenase YqhD (iron-dependent ADH family)